MELDRRQFITASSALAASTVFSTAAAAASPTSSTPLKDVPAAVELPSIDEGKPAREPQPARMPNDGRIGYAIVGLGHLTMSQILPAVIQSKRARVVALVSGDRKKAERVASMYDVPQANIYSYESFDDIAKNPDIHAVYIVLPNSMHCEFTLRAARAGKHVLCEKPMATSVEDAQKMVDACAAAHVRLMIAYRIQYEPRTREAREWFHAGKMGQAKVLDMSNIQNQSKSNLNQWRHKKSLAGGGALPDIGLYCLNTARYLTGEEPIELGASLYSTPGDARFKEVEELVTFWLKFPSGLVANCVTSYGAYSSKRWRANFEKGYAEMDPAFPYSGLRLKRSRAGVDTVTLHGEEVEEIQTEDKNQFIAEVDHFAACIVHNKQPWTPGEEGVQDQRLMKAIYEAAASGKSIALPRIEGKDKFRGTAPA